MRKRAVNCIRFTLPVNDPAEVAILKDHGADELYCGYLDADWRKKYGGDAVISRRQGAANLSDPGALRETAAEARRCGLPLHLTLNGRVTGDETAHLVRIAEMWAGFGGGGIILQDPALPALIARLKPMTITVSLLAVTVNSFGAAFWKGLGADRIVLPRFLTLPEMKAVASSAPDMIFEAMVMGDMCPFADGFCRSVHAETHAPAGPDAAPSCVRETFNPSGRAYHLCMEYGAPVPDPCAACRLKDLKESGVAVGKVGGRGLPLEKRLGWLDFLCLARAGERGGDLPRRYRETFGHECRCYYPKEGHEG